MNTPTQNLTFNILTFKHPADEYTFHFAKEEVENSFRVFHTLVPYEVKEHFGEQEHYYTQYTSNHNSLFAVTKKSVPTYATSEEDEEKTVRVKNSAFTASLLKRYYNKQIHDYFKSNGFIVNPNFVSDTEIWIPSKQINTEYNLFEKYTLKVQFGRITCEPEILIAYAGISKVFRKSIVTLMSQVAPEYFNWVIYRNNLIRHEELSDEAQRNLNEVYPVWNFDIRDALNQPGDIPDKTNPYLKFKKHITDFYNTYLNTGEFKNVIPIISGSFIPVEDVKIGEVADNSNLLLFGQKKYHSVPYKGMDLHGPLEVSPYNKVQFFFICHSSNTDKATQLKNYLEKGLHFENISYKGITNFAKVPFFTLPGFSIVFKNQQNPLPEIEEYLRKREFKDEIRYIAIYISPIPKDNATKSEKDIYYKLKELLLKHKITSQVIDAQKIKNNTNYIFSLNNISIAVLAKLDGVPWRLDVPLRNELIVGVGAFRNIDENIQYIGSAFSFNNNGKFNRFECFMNNQVDELAGSIIRAVKEYASVNRNLQRLIIHFYKNISQKELEPIEKGLKNLGINVPVYIVSINKTESHDIVAFDNSFDNLMPHSGTFINIGFNQFLLFNNTRYKNSTFNLKDGFPFPIKVKITCNKRELENDYKTIKELLNQVYQFSRMYWKSVRQQNLPVTIKYPELVAEMFPHFEGNEIPPFGKDNLWFL
jgi:hypothetical protein